jgi:hypothetical protein
VAVALPLVARLGLGTNEKKAAGRRTSKKQDSGAGPKKLFSLLATN